VDRFGVHDNTVKIEYHGIHGKVFYPARGLEASSV
jgi:hypothetical protein